MIGTYKNNNQSVVVNVGCAGGGGSQSSFGNMKRESDGSLNTGLLWNDGAPIYVKTIRVDNGVLQDMPSDVKEIIWGGIGYPSSFFVKGTAGEYEFVGSGDMLGNVTLVYTKVGTDTSGADVGDDTLSGNF